MEAIMEPREALDRTKRTVGMNSRCPHCKSRMLPGSPWCPACNRCWLPWVIVTEPVIERRFPCKRKRVGGRGHFALSEAQRKAVIAAAKANPPVGWITELAERFGVSGMTINRVARSAQ